MGAAVESAALAGEHPPHDLDSEHALLGALLAGAPVPPALRAGYFYRDEHRLICGAVLALTEAGEPVNELTVTHYLREHGNLEAVGGAVAVSSFTDTLLDMPNVEHYARRVIEEARRREVVRLGGRLQQGAELDEVLDEVLPKLEALVRDAEQGGGLNLLIEPFSEMVAREIPPRGFLVEPWLRERSLSMIYGPKGVGKTNVALTVLVGAASGRAVFGWNIPEPRRVLFVDGELDEEDLRERIAAICRGLNLNEREMLLVGSNLFTLSRDRLAQAGVLFGYLGDPELQAAFRAQLPPEIALVAWDNLSCLFGGEENDASAWDESLLFLLRLKHERAAASIFLHHSGKSGDQRGTSRREDNLDNSLRLEPVKQDSELTADGTHFRTVWAKHRGFKLSQAPSVVCELNLEPVWPPPRPGAQPPMRATWKVSKTDDVRLNVLVECYGEHLREHGAPPTVTAVQRAMHQRADADSQPELAIARATVHKLMNRAKALGLLEEGP